MYDIFLISSNNNFSEFLSIKENFIFAKTANSIEDAQQQSLTNMFWVIWDDVVVDESFDFAFTVSKWDNDIIHIFKNGLCLIPKHASVSKKEIEHKFFTHKKEIDTPTGHLKPYDIFYVDTYEDYLNAKEQSTTDMFWIVPNEVVPLSDFKFDLRFDYYNYYDRNINHMFKNKDIEEDKYNGIMLVSKHKTIPKREIEFRFLVEKKEHDIVASKLKPYDIIFISYDEPNAEKNYKLLQRKLIENKIHRINGIKGIHQAHFEAAKLSTTPMFWVVDADAIVADDFNFTHLVPRYDRYIVHVWHSQNPVNDLEYGYGGIKLLPKKQTLEMNLDTIDMTTSISSNLRVMPFVSNITEFNLDPFSTWRSAFRECVKLSSKIILGQVDEETSSRLNTWCTTGADRPYGNYSILGACAGRKYGEENAADLAALNKINDFDWLKYQFEVNSAAIGNILEITLAQASATS